MNHAMKTFMAASIIALGLAGPIVAARTAGAHSASEAIDSPTEDQLQRYASAVRKVSVVAAEYQPRLEAAHEQAARAAVRVQANQEIAGLIQADGLSLAEYDGISRALHQDPGLRRQVERMASL